MIMATKRQQRTANSSWLLPSDQIRRDSVVMPKDFNTETTTVAMIPAEKPTL